MIVRYIWQGPVAWQWTWPVEVLWAMAVVEVEGNLSCGWGHRRWWWSNDNRCGLPHWWKYHDEGWWCWQNCKHQLGHWESHCSCWDVQVYGMKGGSLGKAVSGLPTGTTRLTIKRSGLSSWAMIDPWLITNVPNICSLHQACHCTSQMRSTKMYKLVLYLGCSLLDACACGDSK